MATKYGGSYYYSSDFRQSIYNAAHNGRAATLRKLLDSYPRDQRKNLVQQKNRDSWRGSAYSGSAWRDTHGETPLQAALLNRKPKATRYLIEECDAHVGQIRLVMLHYCLEH